MQNLVRSKTKGVTGNGGRGIAGAGPGPPSSLASVGDGVVWAMGALLGLSLGAPLWFRPGIAGSRFLGPLLGWLPLLRPGGGRLCWCLGGGGWLGGEGVVVLVCRPHVVASLGVAARGLGLGLLDGLSGRDGLRCLRVYGCGVRP